MIQHIFTFVKNFFGNFQKKIYILSVNSVIQYFGDYALKFTAGRQ